MNTMSQEPYPILEVQSQWVVEPEALGSKEKFWYLPRSEPGSKEWLFKFPRPNTGEHWAEKIAAEIAELMQVPHARVELAVFNGTRGSTSESFVVRTKTKRQDLVHGNEILAGQVTGYDPKRRLRQADHTLENILAAIAGAFIGGAPARVLSALSNYLVLDAVIGNTDRHHENWALLTWTKQDKRVAVMAPSFDHATSLGRELLDESPRQQCRHRLMQEGRVGAYSESGHGAIYWQSTDKRGLSPLELVRRAAREHPDPFVSAIRKACALRREEIEVVIARVPHAWMTPLAREFALELTAYNLQQLRTLCP